MRIPKALFVVLTGVLSLALGATAGSLTPSALPAATMHSLANIYDSIASAAFDSSAIVANQNGSLLANLKYIENQIVWASGSNNIWSLNSGNVGIGTTTPVQKLDVAGSMNISKGSSYRYNNVIFAMASTSLNNYFTGGAGNLTMTGVKNTATGYQALSVNTTGYYNTANGYQALTTNTTGRENTAIGWQALTYNTTGNSNTANGVDALSSNTTGNENTALGTFALYSNTTGNENTAVGFLALDFNTTGVKNTAVGYQALDDNTTGGNNTALGYNTGRGITTGSNNTILGANVTGLAAGLSNTVILADGAGNQRLYINSTGNVGIGTMTPTTTLHVVGDTPILLDVASGSNSRFAVLENGNVGIGTTSPTTKLDVIGAASVSTNFEVRTGYASLSNTLWVSPPGYAGNVGVGTNNPTTKFEVSGGISSISNALYIQNGGNVGIGTTTPLAGRKLEVRGLAGVYVRLSTDTITADVAHEYSNGTSTVYNGLMEGSGGGAGNWTVYAGGGHRLIITQAGNVGIGNDTTPDAALAVKPATTYTGPLFIVASGSNEHFRVTSTGNIGIGTTSPTTKLDVIGAASVSTNFEVRTGYASLSNTLWVSPPGYAGNVGIGTTGPVQKLDVAGSMNISKGSSYRYNNVIFAMASTSLNNYFTGGAGNLTMTGNYNTANGVYALTSNTTGTNNTANGAYALYNNTTGYENTANGYQALFSNTTGSYNTANGMQALYFNTTGNYNTANGYQALFSNTTGSYNTANGRLALYSNTTGYSNTANGESALSSNTTGYQNTANGRLALYLNTTGNYNTANGVYALTSNTTGTNNTANGYGALSAGTNFSNTVGEGYYAGYYASGSNNVFLGANADVVGTYKSGLITNSIAIGSSAKVAASRQLVIGADNGTNYLTEAYFGSGVSASAPFAFRINSSGGRGTNIAGASLTLAGGISTGTGPGGSLLFQTSPAGGSGATANTLTTRMTIDSTGNIGIGDTSPTAKFELVGGSGITLGTVASISGTSLTTGSLLQLTVPPSSSFSGPILVARDTNNLVLASLSSGGRFSIRGNIFSHGAVSNCTGVGAPVSGCLDYAESFPTTDPSLSAGEIVAVDPLNASHVIRASGTTTILGIISTTPAALIDGNAFKTGADATASEGSVPVALAGRVPVNISTEHGPILPGDSLSLSPTIPGTAVKALSAGTTIGIALEPSLEACNTQHETADADAPCRILIFVNRSYHAPDMDQIASGSPQLTASASLFARILDYLKDIVLTVRGVVADRVQTRELCLDDVCVTRDQLHRLLEVNMLSPATPTPIPTPVVGIDVIPAPTASDSVTLTPAPTPSNTPGSSPTTTDIPVETSTPSDTPSPTPETLAPAATP